MANIPQNQGIDTGQVSSGPRTPGWVKAFLAFGVAFVVVFAWLHLSGRSPHGHGAHMPASPTAPR